MCPKNPQGQNAGLARSVFNLAHLLTGNSDGELRSCHHKPIELKEMKTEQRHAQEHWLRLQAEAALGLADEVEPDMNAVKIAIKDVPVLPLQGLRKGALEEAARQLVKSELIHREIVRRGGTV